MMIVFSSVFIHEIFHLICGKFLGMKLKFSGAGMFGMKIDYEDGGNISDRLTVYFGGITGNIFIASLAGIYSFRTGADTGMFMKYNLLMAFLNLIPVYPLDGGRIMECVLSVFFGRLKAVKTVGLCGILTGCVMFVFGIYLYLFYTDNILLPVLGIFIIYNSDREVKTVNTAYVRKLLGDIEYP